ncbi:hypothetical protein [Burkholderia stabilis]
MADAAYAELYAESRRGRNAGETATRARSMLSEKTADESDVHGVKAGFNGSCSNACNAARSTQHAARSTQHAVATT